MSATSAALGGWQRQVRVVEALRLLLVGQAEEEDDHAGLGGDVDRLSAQGGVVAAGEREAEGEDDVPAGGVLGGGEGVVEAGGRDVGAAGALVARGSGELTDDGNGSALLGGEGQQSVVVDQQDRAVDSDPTRVLVVGVEICGDVVAPVGAEPIMHGQQPRRLTAVIGELSIQPHVDRPVPSMTSTSTAPGRQRSCHPLLGTIEISWDVEMSGQPGLLIVTCTAEAHSDSAEKLAVLGPVRSTR